MFRHSVLPHKMIWKIFPKLAVVAVALYSMIVGVSMQVDADGHKAAIIELDGIIAPVTQRYLENSLEAATKVDSEVVIIKLDTPGGLLDSTLVVITTEFGRTPRINDLAGRDHWPNAFSITMRHRSRLK